MFALLPFAISAAVLDLPLTTEPALNAYVALTFGVLGLLVVIAAMQSLGELFRFGRAPLPDPAMILPPGAPPPDVSGTGRYALRWHQRSPTRLGETAVGVLFAGNVVPLIGILFGAESSVVGNWAVILNFVIGAIALLGIGLLVDSAFSRDQTIFADEAGLTAGRHTLRWSDVEEVVAHVPGRMAERFTVVGDEGDVTIEWPAKVDAKPRPGTQAITPSELAALVVARSGKALRVAED